MTSPLIRAGLNVGPRRGSFTKSACSSSEGSVCFLKFLQRLLIRAGAVYPNLRWLPSEPLRIGLNLICEDTIDQEAVVTGRPLRAYKSRAKGLIQHFISPAL